MAGFRVTRRRAHPEADEQATVIAWARRQVAAAPGRYQGLHLLHCSLSGHPMTPAQAGRAKAQGMLAGVPDLLLLVPRGGYHGLLIEMKRPSGGRVSAEQKSVMADLRALGYRCEVCAGASPAIELIQDYLLERLQC